MSLDAFSLSPTERAAWASALAALDPPPRDIFAEICYTPTPKQRLFHDATEFDLLFGGSLGGGKSRALMAEAIRACALYPGIRVGAFRRSYTELKDSLVAELAAMDFGAAVGGRWNGTEFELRFANGSLLMLRYAENLVDATRRQGGQYQLLLFDERTLTQPDVISFLESRLRSGRADIPVLGIRSTANPGGPGHGAVRSRYIDATNYGQHVVTDDTGRTIRFIPSSMTDNPHLDPGYERRLLALPEPMRKAMRDGDWGVFSGQIFVELNRERHVIDPIELPVSWKRYNGIDWGWRAPWAVLWAAVDEDGRVWVYREIYETQVGESVQAQRILAAETDGEHVVARYADDALWQERGEAKAIADVYAKNGVHLTKAGKGPGSRVQGWQRVHSYLAEAPACPHHRALGWDTCPLLHMFPQVENLFKELRDLPYATKGNPEDADSSAPDHLCLVAGTSVLTRRGDVPIEHVTIADEVMTRTGWRRIVAAGLTGTDQPVSTVVVGDGRTLTGTPGHPVHVIGKGFVRLDALRYSDILLMWPTVKPSYLTGLPIDATRTLHGDPIGCTSPQVAAIASGESGDFIRRFGKPLTERSQRTTTSITETTILATTAWIIWSVWLKLSTARSTTHRESGLHGLRLLMLRRWSRRRNGTAVMRDVRGTKNMHRTSTLVARPIEKRVVSSAGTGTVQTRLTRQTGSAPTIANRLGAALAESITSVESVFNVARSSPQTSISPQNVALNAVRGVYAAGTADVYSITVEGTREYFANGILVHNCDSLRYLLVNLGTEPKFHFSDPEPVARELDPQATGPRPPQPLPATYGGFPVLTEGNSIWG